MKTYRVWFTITNGGYADVEASSLAEAVEKANFLEPEDYVECDDRDWEVDLTSTHIENKDR